MNTDLDAEHVHRLLTDPAAVLGRPAADAIDHLLRDAPPLDDLTAQWLRAQFAQPRAA